jgi:hypothetical protein
VLCKAMTVGESRPLCSAHQRVALALDSVASALRGWRGSRCRARSARAPGGGKIRMFLLPPVPGVPVYSLTGGFFISLAGRETIGYCWQWHRCCSVLATALGLGGGFCRPESGSTADKYNFITINNLFNNLFIYLTSS